jgi:hypothetical protein
MNVEGSCLVPFPEVVSQKLLGGTEKIIKYVSVERHSPEIRSRHISNAQQACQPDTLTAFIL